MAALQHPGAGAYGLAGRNARTAIGLALLVLAMGTLAYASVPLYALFCQVTGFGGTTQVAERPAEQVLDRAMNVRFIATVHPSLDWTFAAPGGVHPVRLGEDRTITYIAENTGEETVVGTASYNVSPDKAGLYFDKIDCFCFTQQVLRPGERVAMPVRFFIDPALADDVNLDDVTAITLSYTFFRSQDQSAATAVRETVDATAARRLD